MTQVTVGENEGIESALRRFKRQVSKAGIFADLKRLRHHETPTEKYKREAQQRRRDGCKPGRREYRAARTGDVCERLCQRIVDFEAFKAVASSGAVQRLDVGKQNGRAALDWRVDRAVGARG